MFLLDLKVEPEYFKVINFNYLGDSNIVSFTGNKKNLYKRKLKESNNLSVNITKPIKLPIWILFYRSGEIGDMVHNFNGTSTQIEFRFLNFDRKYQIGYEKNLSMAGELFHEIDLYYRDSLEKKFFDM